MEISTFRVCCVGVFMHVFLSLFAYVMDVCVFIKERAWKNE